MLPGGPTLPSGGHSDALLFQISAISHFWKCWSLSRVRLFATPWTVARQAPLSMEFSRQEYWSGLPWPSPGDLPDPGNQTPVSHITGRFFTVWATWEAHLSFLLLFKWICSHGFTFLLYNDLTIISVLTINFLENTKYKILVFGLIRNDLLFYSSAGGIGWTYKYFFEQTDNNARPKWQSSQVRAKCYSGHTTVTFTRFLITSSTFLGSTASAPPRNRVRLWFITVRKMRAGRECSGDVL